MNGDKYEKLIGAKFAEWREQCFPDGLPVQFVQDHEHCLRQDRSIAALSKAGCPVVQNFPEHSPDQRHCRPVAPAPGALGRNSAGRDRDPPWVLVQASPRCKLA